MALGPVHLRDGGSRFVPMFGPDAFCRPTRAKGLGKAKATAQKPTASTAPHASVKDRVELRRGVPPSRATPVLIWSAHGGAASPFMFWCKLRGHLLSLGLAFFLVSFSRVALNERRTEIR